MSTSPSPKRNPQGIIEIFSYKTATVAILNHKVDTIDQSSSYVRWMNLGQFSINVVTHLINAITVTICSLDGFHWPLAMDIPIFRMGKRTFVICFPGLTYALQFPPICEPTHIGFLEKIFEKSSHYYDYAENDPQYFGKKTPL